VRFHNLLADRETGARALVILAPVQPAKDTEDLLVILRLDADAVCP